MSVIVKICGLSTAETVAAAVDGGASYVGFVFYPPSPRYVTVEQAQELTTGVAKGVSRVGLVVNPDDGELRQITEGGFLDFIQLHGNETPQRVAQIKERFNLPIIKAVAIAGPEDVKTAKTYETVADLLLFDAMAPEHSTSPGGNALSFDWQLINEQRWEIPWLLAGGLDVDNLAQAVRISGAIGVDVSSGVEIKHGVKSPDKIKAFLQLAVTL